MNHQSLQTDPIRNGHTPPVKGAPWIEMWLILSRGMRKKG